MIYYYFDRKILDQRDSVYEKIAQYLQLKNTIKSIQVFYLSFLINSFIHYFAI